MPGTIFLSSYISREWKYQRKVEILIFFLVFQAKGVGCIGGGGDSKWDIDDDDMEEEVKAESAVKSKIPEQSTGRF